MAQCEPCIKIYKIKKKDKMKNESQKENGEGDREHTEGERRGREKGKKKVFRFSLKFQEIGP